MRHLLNVVVLSSSLFLFCSLAADTSSTYNVVSLGAKPDGKTDSTKAFLSAWDKSCHGGSAAATIYVPRGRFLLRNSVFKGPCKSKHIVIRIYGTLVAPSGYKSIGNYRNWLYFEHVSRVSINGGILDGQGTSLWDCKRTRSQGCPRGTTSLRFSNCSKIKINGLTSRDSQLYHISINGCHNVKLHGVNVHASAHSPNTDGIHVDSSRLVSITKSRIATGDDCISIGPGTTGLWIENIHCGPGHGISIGSLGKTSEEAGVQNVTVKNATFTQTQNGLRIKTWGRPSTGFARNILFQHAIMDNVKYPIIIDQNYCPHQIRCPGQVSGVKISDVTYQDIHGTSATEIGVKFDCSPQHPCSHISLRDVNLTYNNQPAMRKYSNIDVVGGYASGSMQLWSSL